MGWWSTTVMGGDEPLDIQGFIFDLANVDQFGKDGKNAVIPAEFFVDNQKQILSYLSTAMQAETEEENYIIIQVLGVMLMERGFAFDPDIKELVIAAAENDEWATYDKERRTHMQEFIKAVQNYDNKTPTTITQ